MTVGAMVFVTLAFVLAARSLVAAFDPMGRGDDTRGGIFYRMLRKK